MKLFIKRVLFFSIIFFVYFVIACWIDPFNIIHREHNPSLMKKKIEISFKINPILYNLQKYKDNPTDAILLGDSRTIALKASKIENLTQKKATNLGIGGGTIPEIIETFWYISNMHELKEVYIGINFNLYNEHNRNNRVNEAIKLSESPISYLCSQYCYESLFLIIKSIITKKKDQIGTHKLNKEEFWKYSLKDFDKFYALYKYPYLWEKNLTDISHYCAIHKIKLIFFIPPTHTELQQKVKLFNLEVEEKLFKSALFNIGTTFDYDYSNEITVMYDNYKDPLHFKDSISNIIIKEIMANNKNQIRYARIHNEVDLPINYRLRQETYK